MSAKPTSPFPEKMISEWYSWSETSPEEYAAHRSHLIGEFSFDEYAYENKKMEDWLIRLGDIIRDPKKSEECRKKYLSADEYKAVKRSISEILND